ARGEDRQRAVLVAGSADASGERAAPFDHERLRRRLPQSSRRQGGGYRSGAVRPTREQAWDTLTRYTKSEPLLRHALAVEASTASYAPRFAAAQKLCPLPPLLPPSAP